MLVQLLFVDITLLQLNCILVIHSYVVLLRQGKKLGEGFGTMQTCLTRHFLYGYACPKSGAYNSVFVVVTYLFFLKNLFVHK